MNCLGSPSGIQRLGSLLCREEIIARVHPTNGTCVIFTGFPRKREVVQGWGAVKEYPYSRSGEVLR